MHIPTIDEIKLRKLSDEKDFVRECEEKIVKMVETYAKALSMENRKFAIVNDEHITILKIFIDVLGIERCNSILKQMNCSLFELDQKLYLFPSERPDFETSLELNISVILKNILIFLRNLLFYSFIAISVLMIQLKLNFTSLMLLCLIFIALVLMRVIYSIIQWRNLSKYGSLVNDNGFYKLKYSLIHRRYL